mgnify:FL=1
MVLTLEEAKTWLRIDSDEEDSILEMLIGAAETYLHNATGNRFSSENQLAKMYCLVLCADWYENRDLIGQQPSEKIRFTCQSIMAQLQHAYGGDEDG